MVSLSSLTVGKRYQFVTYKDINNNENKSNKFPHYYKGTYAGRKGKGLDESTWVFRNFIEIENGKIINTQKKKEIQYFENLRLVVDLVDETIV